MDKRNPYGSIEKVEEFNPYNLEHIKAFNHLAHHGTWPEGFVFKEIEDSYLWIHTITAKLAMAYIKEKLDHEKEK